VTDGTLTRDDLQEDLRNALAPMHAQLGALPLIQQSIARLEQDVNALRLETGAIRRQGTVNAGLLEELATKIRMVEAAVNDIAVAEHRVSAGEIASLHADINRMNRKIADLTARLQELEGRAPVTS